MHWGEEFRAAPGPREEALAARLTARGVELIIGSHPHRAGALTGDRTQCLAFSLGNFIFDQRRPEVSGALLEVIFYPQGTYFLRLHPLGNLYGETFPVKPGAALADHANQGAPVRPGPGINDLLSTSNLTGGFEKPMKRIGVALGAGGAKGLSHIAFLQALDDLGVRPAVMAGTSIGAVIGGFYAAGVSGARLEQLVKEIGFRDLYKIFLDFSLLSESGDL